MVDMEVAIRLHRDVDARMAGEQVKHMVEEADAGRDLGHARAVEVHGHLDVGFLGFALNRRRAHEKGSPRLRKRALLTGSYRLRYCGKRHSEPNFSLW